MSTALLLLAVLAAALIAIVGIYLYWVHVEHRLTEISPGRVFTSSAMTPVQTAALAKRLSLSAVVDFRHPGTGDIQGERDALAAIGVRHLHVPADQNPTADQVRHFLATLQPELQTGGRVLLHCEHGEGRAVFFGCVYRVAFEGWSGEKAYLASQRLPRTLCALNRVWPGLGRLSASNLKAQMLRRFAPGLGEWMEAR